jgi:hypothetical protein
VNSGTLFTQDFLQDGVRATTAFAGLTPERLDDFRARLSDVLTAVSAPDELNEAQTEQRVVRPVLEILGFSGLYDVQTNLERVGRATVPDYLLYRDEEDFAAAETGGGGADRRILHATAVMDAKAWNVGLDKRNHGSMSGETPSAQILRYMSRAETVSDRRVQWGILTSGRVWRLYFQGAKSRLEEYYEADLPEILAAAAYDDPEAAHELKLFLLIFSRAAFVDGDDGRSFHRLALDEGRLWEERVRAELSDAVFREVFPNLIAALAAADPSAPTSTTDAYLADVREAALTLLYRLLFAFYAEDRDLLPRRDRHYDDYGLSPHRDRIGERIDAADRFSAKQSRLYCACRELFACIDRGDDSIGLPPYNGGLFRADRAPLLDRIRLSDAAFAPLFDRLSRTMKGERRVRINYRDLSVRELGAIYERLLEFAPTVEGTVDGTMVIRATPFARKGTGSYYTPEDLVRLTIRRTLAPLLEERRAAFRRKAEELASDRRPPAERLALLRPLDPAMRILDLKVVDPAMGSGHFLVSLIDHLAEQAYAAMGAAAEIVDWGDYRSPLPDELERMRAGIRERAAARGWTMGEGRLDDRNLVKRMALKRCVYGVDKNPMAVELAKVALWLHTFTVGAPLSFLDHHLRCGDSLFGEWVRPTMDGLAAKGALFINKSVQRAKAAFAGMARIESLSDAELEEVKESEAEFVKVDECTRPLSGFLSLMQALRWLEPLTMADRTALDALLFGKFGDPVAVAARLESPRPPDETEASRRDFAAISALLGRVWALIDEQRFFAWEAAFPGVWRDWESADPQGGFDAVISNPPWDRMKMQEVEWFADRAPEIARQERAADRKAAVAARRAANDPLAAQYDLAAERAETAMRVARQCGEFPLLSKGDVNLYSLFVERAHRLVAPHGLVGLVTPSGILSDRTASPFIEKVFTEKRVAYGFDFFNKRHDGELFFPEVYYRFKFCVFITGGKIRFFEQPVFCFFARSTKEAESPAKALPLTEEMIRTVNTGAFAIPIFRSAEDAALTVALASSKNLVRLGGLQNFKYSRQFDMGTDSEKFETAERLAAKGGYPLNPATWRAEGKTWTRLYEGKMVQAYDHRAASIGFYAENTFRTGESLATPPEEHRNPAFTIAPRFYVELTEERWRSRRNWALAFKDVTSTTNTRTVIAAMIPKAGAGHTLPLLRYSGDDPVEPALLCANLNAVILDFLARQKVQNNHLTWTIVADLPVIPFSNYDRVFGEKTARDIVVEHVLELTCTADDMADFAADLGRRDGPFIWNDEKRRHLRARLDALYFILYGIVDDHVIEHVFSTFPALEKKDRENYNGAYLSEMLTRWYLRALLSGDATSAAPTDFLIAQQRRRSKRH